MNDAWLINLFIHVIMIEYLSDHLIIYQGSPQAGVKAERVGVVWAEFVTTSIDSFPTSKLN